MNEIKFGSDLGSTIVNTKTKVAYPNSMRIIADIIRKYGPNKFFIISRVNTEQKVRAQAWLNQSRFFGQTGMPEQNLFWCEERHQKAVIAKDLGLTHFVDDRPDVLIPMISVPHRFLFNPRLEDLEQFKKSLSGIRIIDSWNEFGAILA